MWRWACGPAGSGAVSAGSCGGPPLSRWRTGGVSVCGAALFLAVAQAGRGYACVSVGVAWRCRVRGRGVAGVVPPCRRLEQPWMESAPVWARAWQGCVIPRCNTGEIMCVCGCVKRLGCGRGACKVGRKLMGVLVGVREVLCPVLVCVQ